MSKNCRGVQGIGFVFVLIGIIAMAAAALMYFGAPSVELDIEDGVQIAQMFGIILFVIGLVQFIFGVVGMRAAKHENLLKPFSWMCGIDIILNLSVVGLTFTSGEGGEIWPNLIFAAVALSGLIFSYRAMLEKGVK